MSSTVHGGGKRQASCGPVSRLFNEFRERVALITLCAVLATAGPAPARPSLLSAGVSVRAKADEAEYARLGLNFRQGDCMFLFRGWPRVMDQSPKTIDHSNDSDCANEQPFNFHHLQPSHGMFVGSLCQISHAKVTGPFLGKNNGRLENADEFKDRRTDSCDDVAEMKQFPDYTELWLSRDYKIEVREEPDAIFAAPDAADW